MPVPAIERYEDPREVIQSTVDQRQAEMWTTLPGIIQSFDASKQTVTVQPAIKALVRMPDDTVQQVDLPVIPDVPVRFPAGGGYVLTWPLQPGDECSLAFSSRCIDNWWQSGGVQPPFENRMHDLSDAICYPGAMSQSAKFNNISTGTAQLRSADGKLVVDLDAAGKKLTITCDQVSALFDSNANTVTVTANELRCTGNIVAGYGGSDQVEVQQHVHSDVVVGPSNTGPPVPGS